MMVLARLVENIDIKTNSEQAHKGEAQFYDDESFEGNLALIKC